MIKRVFVSGASKGIGKAIIQELDKADYELIGCARTSSDLEELKNEIKHAKFSSLALDLTKEEDILLLKDYFREHGFPHIVIANMNVTKPYRTIEKHASHSDFFDSISDHLKYLVAITPESLKVQRADGFGRWIGISSAISALNGITGQGFYLMQKRMLEAYIDTLVLEANHENITANCILPGLIETDRIKKNILFETLNKFNLKERAGKPEEVSFMVSCLLDDKAGYITGEKITIDGGSTKTWMINQFLKR
jgi:NAD(P)-dependent dehydrogenase (short-subunit alcohol dehydrogenase family)